MQETFIAVFRGLSRFRGESRAVDVDRSDRGARRVRSHPRAASDAGLARCDRRCDGGAPEVDGQRSAREGLRRLYAALAELVPEARMAFALYAIDGRIDAEVAALTGTPP